MLDAQWYEQPEELKSTLGHRLKMSLRFARISVEEMAEYYECHRNTLSGWLADRTTPMPILVRVWAERTGVPLEWIKTGAWPEKPTTGRGEWRDLA